MEKESDREDRIKKSLKYSVIDGSFYTAMVGFGESFFSAFAVFLKATNFQIGLLSSLPQALSAFLQIFSNKLISMFKSRKMLVCTAALIQSLMYILVALTFFFGKFSVYALIIFVSLYYVLGMTLNPAWTSWMGDLVSEKERGSYFGMRNRVTGFFFFVSFIAAGYILQKFSVSGYVYLGFVAIFAIALISRVFSFIYLTKKYEPEYVQLKENYFSFADFIKQSLLSTNYGTFVLYLCLMNFSIYVAAPFFTPYMLKDLAFDYRIFTIITAVAIITKFIMMPVWGKLSDKYGTIKVLTLCGFLMPICPLLWVFSADIHYLILVQIFSGFFWAGFELASFNFILDSTTPQKRAICVSYYNAFNGFAVLFGAFVGILIVRYNASFWSPYLLVFITSFFLRFLVSFLLLPKIKERRQVEKTSYPQLLFDSINIRPTAAWAGVTVARVTGTVIHAGNAVAHVGKMMKGNLNYKKKDMADKKSDEELQKKD
jgi:MFS family permease